MSYLADRFAEIHQAVRMRRIVEGDTECFTCSGLGWRRNAGPARPQWRLCERCENRQGNERPKDQ